MSSVSDLAAVVCHGSYYTPAPYGPPSGALLDVLRPLVSQGKEVLIVGHHAGSWDAAEAAQPNLQAKSWKDKGLKGGIIGVFFIGAFIIPVGQSINGFFQPEGSNPITPPLMRFHKRGIDGLGTMVQPEVFLFNGIDQAEAEKWKATLTRSPILSSKITNDAYAALPCAYLVLEKDRTLPKEYQEGMVAAQAQETDEFTVYRCPSGHSPHLTWTDGLVNTVQDFVEKIRS
ncbi:hypothetical protein M426DRAFT_75444 [Hypoxylon sp. CI-4A]|nr:hypothetical protein M426DRAFT_75444 [Hypoxylon sp. CI-4A]